jgi:hypothetical protein
MARYSFRKSPRAHRLKLYMFVQLIANLLCITDWTSGLVGWESFMKLLCLHAYSLYAPCRKRFIQFYSDRVWWLLCCFWGLECSWNEGGWFHCLFISYTSLHEWEQVYMRVNSFWSALQRCIQVSIEMLVYRGEAYLLAGVFFQNKRNPDLYLAHQYCGYFCARFPSPWRCIAWFILFKMRNLNVHWWMGTFPGCLFHCPNPSAC